MRKMSYLNAVLTAIAVLLALNLMVVLGDSNWPAAASAQPNPSKDGQFVSPFNSAEDRKVLISGLDTLNTRLASIEAKLDKGINVVVTKMPPITIAERSKEDKREPNPDTRIEVKKDGQK